MVIGNYFYKFTVINSSIQVIAGKQVLGSNAPSFCRNRLFTNNYRTWFNVCTSPTSGPTLVKHDIFNPQTRQGSALTSRYGAVTLMFRSVKTSLLIKANKQMLSYQMSENVSN